MCSALVGLSYWVRDSFATVEVVEKPVFVVPLPSLLFPFNPTTAPLLPSFLTHMVDNVGLVVERDACPAIHERCRIKNTNATTSKTAAIILKATAIPAISLLSNGARPPTK